MYHARFYAEAGSLLRVSFMNKSACTVEPLNIGHIGTDHFVHYREVVLFQRQNVSPLYRLVHRKAQRCPLFRVSFIRGSTVYISLP